MIKVLTVDDSALIREVLREIINAQPDMRVVGAAADPVAAREKIKALNPDVITLDVEMPRMDGLSFLERLMQLRPMPVVMISSLTERNATATLRALELGAVDFVAKPKLDIRQGIEAYAELIADKIRAAARASIRPRAAMPVPRLDASAVIARHSGTAPVGDLIAIGASTGGTEAIRVILERLPDTLPPILVAQHMPEMFTRTFAERLDALCTLRVKEAEDGELARAGHAYIAPGHAHLLVKSGRDGFRLALSDAAPVNRHRPSVDVLFRAVANVAGHRAVGVILTGMGADGAQGLREMREAGAFTIAQDEASCVVYGMPRSAVELDAAVQTLSLDDIAHALLARAHLAA